MYVSVGQNTNTVYFIRLVIEHLFTLYDWLLNTLLHVQHLD